LITCEECRDRMKPEDPRVPTGPYHHSTCDYFCSKPTYYRELEVVKADPPVVTYEHQPHVHKYTEVKRGTDTF